jgi:hypothetical protein
MILAMIVQLTEIQGLFGYMSNVSCRPLANSFQIFTRERIAESPVLWSANATATATRDCHCDEHDNANRDRDGSRYANSDGSGSDADRHPDSQREGVENSDASTAAAMFRMPWIALTT